MAQRAIGIRSQSDKSGLSTRLASGESDEDASDTSSNLNGGVSLVLLSNREAE